jgi:hypothetical protein
MAGNTEHKVAVGGKLRTLYLVCVAIANVAKVELGEVARLIEHPHRHHISL